MSTDMSEFPDEIQLGAAVKTLELVVVQGKVKENQDLAPGQLVCNNGAGFEPATAVMSNTRTVFVNRDPYDYAVADAVTEPEAEKHNVALYAKGVVVAMKDTTVALVKSQKLKVGTTGKATAVTAATDIIIGSCCIDTNAADDRVIIRLGQ